MVPQDNSYFPPDPHNNSLIFLLKSCGMVTNEIRLNFRTKLLFFIFYTINIWSFAQTDQIVLIGQEKPISVKIIDLAGNVSFKNLSDDKVLIIPMSHIQSIKLNTTNNQKYFTSDLFASLKKYDASKFVWFGLDFTMVKIYDLGHEYKYTNGLFKSMNKFVLDPDKKFYALWTCIIPGNLSCIKNIECDPVDLRNEKISMKSCFITEFQRNTNLDSIRKSIHNLEINKYKEGIGILFFYDYLNKSTEEIAGYIVFFDITSREVILAFYAPMKSDGVTMEWHWTKGIHDLLNEFRKEGWFYKKLYNLYNFHSSN